MIIVELPSCDRETRLDHIIFILHIPVHKRIISTTKAQSNNIQIFIYTKAYYHGIAIIVHRVINHCGILRNLFNYIQL